MPQGLFRSEAAIVSEAAIEKATKKNPGTQGIEDLETASKKST